MKFAVLLALAGVLAVMPAFAQGSVVNSAPQPIAAAPAIPAPRDVAYPGTLTLEVDATDLDRRIFGLKQTIPVSKAGRLTLLYSEWIPGNHAPRGPIYNYSGIKFTANGKTLKWTRDPADVYAFHVDVPSGVKAIQVEAQFLRRVVDAEFDRAPVQVFLGLIIGGLQPDGHGRKVLWLDENCRKCVRHGSTETVQSHCMTTLDHMSHDQRCKS